MVSPITLQFYDEIKSAPMIQECPVNYLCKVIQTIPIFDFTMFIGEIVAVYANESCIVKNKSDAMKVNPVILMDTGYFNLNDRIGSIFNVCKGTI
jgi:flavin reductase (DIM6/NTAB) family NADH-FMN oxidoreductase RutF